MYPRNRERGYPAGRLPAFGGPRFQFEVDNLTGTPANGTPGTSFSFGGSSADGADVAVLSALAQDVQYLIVGVAGAATAAEDNSALLDILTDPAGGTSWVDTISDLSTGFTPATTNSGIPIQCWYYLPVFVRAGTSIGVHARKAGATAATGRVVMYAYGQPLNPDMWWCGTGVETLGATPATSRGVSHTPGTSGSYASFTTIGTSTRRYGAIQIGINGTDDIANAAGYHFQLGTGSAQISGTPTFYVATNTSETMQRSGFNGPVWCDIPAATDVQVRGTCNGTAEAFNVTVHGVY